ncbi:uncharacterized protein LOC128082581 [Tympanuchus pallidicinctus]|uniref:uncharacterized protein LOC128082581 n=1 Tax=Tympanuchus pallidicinctus TaxID=109042 RepID=UPI00228703BE|nr:uncharacterized protein LOC128082581 [Tympanuchus pallidicinctus]
MKKRPAVVKKADLRSRRKNYGLVRKRKFSADGFCVSAINAVRWISGSGSTAAVGSSITESIRFSRGRTPIGAQYPESILLSIDQLTARAGKSAVIGKERTKSSFSHFNFCYPRGREAGRLRASGQVPARPRPLAAQCRPRPRERRRPARNRASLPPPPRPVRRWNSAAAPSPPPVRGLCDVTCYLAVINLTDTGMPEPSQSLSDRNIIRAAAYPYCNFG